MSDHSGPDARPAGARLGARCSQLKLLRRSRQRVIFAVGKHAGGLRHAIGEVVHSCDFDDVPDLMHGGARCRENDGSHFRRAVRLHPPGAVGLKDLDVGAEPVSRDFEILIEGGRREGVCGGSLRDRLTATRTSRGKYFKPSRYAICRSVFPKLKAGLVHHSEPYQ